MMGLLDAGRGWLFLVIAVDLGGDLAHLALRETLSKFAHTTKYKSR